MEIGVPTVWLSTAYYNNANVKMMNDVWSMLPFVVWFVTVFGSLKLENGEKLNRCCAIHVSLRAPRYVMMGGSASLHCDYDVDEDQIHKVEWLRGENKIYQYVKGRNPPYRNFTISGADIDWSDTDSRKVSLKNLQFEASGVYTCEVSTNHPIYTKPSDEEYLTVMQSQMHDPHITFNQANFTVGDMLDANCTSSPATPVPELTWLLNGKKADETWIRSFPEVKQSSSMVQLTMTVSLENAPQLRVTCLSTIPGYLGHHVQDTEYADYRSHTINVDVAVPPTEAAQTAGTEARTRCRWQISVLLLLVGMFTITSL